MTDDQAAHCYATVPPDRSVRLRGASAISRTRIPRGDCARLRSIPCTCSEHASQNIRLIEAGAFVVTFALQELEIPQWKLRRIVYDDPQWHCSSSKHSALPMELRVFARCKGLESTFGSQVIAAIGGQHRYDRCLHRGARHWIHCAGLCQGRRAGGGAGHHRTSADILDRTYAGSAGAARLARPRLCIFGHHAACRAGSRRLLFLERRRATRLQLARRCRASGLQGPIFSPRRLDRACDRSDS
jgi:hypothetical protein